MRRSVAVFVVVAVLMFGILVSYAAPPEVYFVAVNDTLLALNERTMPFVRNNLYYVSYRVFEDNPSLGVYASYNQELYSLTLFNKDYQITFNSLQGVAFDRNEQYPMRLSANSFGEIFVPIVFVCEKFGIKFSDLRTTPARTLRLVSKTAMSDDDFMAARKEALAGDYLNYAYPPSPSPTRSQSWGASPQPSPSPSPRPEPKAVYLTFENGPTAYTAEIMDVLSSYGISATFFVDARGAESYGAEVRRIVGEGHTLGVSSYVADVVSESTIVSDLSVANAAIDRAVGTKTRVLRLSGGSTSAQYSDSDRDALIQAGYRYWDWTIDGTNRSSSQRIVNTVISGLRGAQGASIVRFSQDEMTLEALSDILFHIKNGNYAVRAISASEMPINFKNDVRSAVE